MKKYAIFFLCFFLASCNHIDQKTIDNSLSRGIEHSTTQSRGYILHVSPIIRSSQLGSLQFGALAITVLPYRDPIDTIDCERGFGLDACRDISSMITSQKELFKKITGISTISGESHELPWCFTIQNGFEISGKLRSNTTSLGMKLGMNISSGDEIGSYPLYSSWRSYGVEYGSGFIYKLFATPTARINDSGDDAFGVYQNIITSGSGEVYFVTESSVRSGTGARVNIDTNGCMDQLPVSIRIETKEINRILPAGKGGITLRIPDDLRLKFGSIKLMKNDGTSVVLDKDLSAKFITPKSNVITYEYDSNFIVHISPDMLINTDSIDILLKK